MEDGPHVVVIAFERLVLFPLNVCVPLAGIIFLFERAWLFGAFLLFISLFLGIVGQGLPHNKKLTAQQLSAGHKWEQRFGNITPEDSLGLGKAVLLTAFLVSLIAGAVAVHRNLQWYWILASVVISWFLFPLASMLFCFAWAWGSEKMSSKSRKA